MFAQILKSSDKFRKSPKNFEKGIAMFILVAYTTKKYQGEWNIDNIKEFADRAMAMEGLMRIEGIRIIDKESKEIVLETVR